MLLSQAYLMSYSSCLNLVVRMYLVHATAPQMIRYSLYVYEHKKLFPTSICLVSCDRCCQSHLSCGPWRHSAHWTMRLSSWLSSALWIFVVSGTYNGGVWTSHSPYCEGSSDFLCRITWCVRKCLSDCTLTIKVVKLHLVNDWCMTIKSTEGMT